MPGIRRQLLRGYLQAVAELVRQIDRPFDFNLIRHAHESHRGDRKRNQLPGRRVLVLDPDILSHDFDYRALLGCRIAGVEHVIKRQSLQHPLPVRVLP